MEKKWRVEEEVEGSRRVKSVINVKTKGQMVNNKCRIIFGEKEAESHVTCTSSGIVARFNMRTEKTYSVLKINSGQKCHPAP